MEEAHRKNMLDGGPIARHYRDDGALKAGHFGPCCSNYVNHGPINRQVNHGDTLPPDFETMPALAIHPDIIRVVLDREASLVQRFTDAL